jgi:dihydroorotase
LEAPFGVLGLETAVGVTYTQLVRTGLLSVMEWASRWTCTPAGVLGRPPPTLAPGAAADIAVLDVTSEWRVKAAHFASRSRNTSFEGWPLVGRARWTLYEGRVVWDALQEPR